MCECRCSNATECYSASNIAENHSLNINSLWFLSLTKVTIMHSDIIFKGTPVLKFILLSLKDAESR